MGKATAMILAAGRGERMRPLTDELPKPLLRVAGKPLVVHQIEALARAGHRDIAINASHLAGKLVDALGDGGTFGATLHWSIEPEPLETLGGIATARPLLADGAVLIVSGDLWTAYDYASIGRHRERVDAARGRAIHLVMVPNPPYHPQGDFALDGALEGLDAERLLPHGRNALTYGNIGLYDTALFDELPRGARLKLLPLMLDCIHHGRATGEYYSGPWANLGTPDDLARLETALAKGA
jgi:MurNAc alpha-1-phosphate uridylyltransferase